MKVTIKHYLNKRLKPKRVIYKGQEEFAYPLYVQILYKGQQSQIKSDLTPFVLVHKESSTTLTDYFERSESKHLSLLYLTDQEFKSIIDLKIYPLIIKESDWLYSLVQMIDQKFNDFDVKKVVHLRNNYLEPLDSLWMGGGQERLLNLMKPIFLAKPKIEGFFRMYFDELYDADDRKTKLFVDLMDDICDLLGDGFEDVKYEIKRLFDLFYFIIEIDFGVNDMLGTRVDFTLYHLENDTVQNLIKSIDIDASDYFTNRRLDKESAINEIIDRTRPMILDV